MFEDKDVKTLYTRSTTLGTSIKDINKKKI